MLASLKNLLAAPYNKQYPLFALRRFAYWKFIRLMKRKNVLYKLWEDRYLYLDYNSLQCMWIMYNYIVDWEEFNLIGKLVKQGDTVADIGTNMGFYSIWMSKFTNRPGCIHSFEPDANNYERLKKNIAVNKLDEVIKANKKGVGSSKKEVIFTTGLDGENHIATEKGNNNTVTIQLITLDDYCSLNKIAHIVYCKIDVEGFEADVLKGSANMLRQKNIDVIQLEINRALQNSGYTAEALVSLIEAYGYSLCAYNVEKNQFEATQYLIQRENYFAVADVANINKKLLK